MYSETIDKQLKEYSEQKAAIQAKTMGFAAGDEEPTTAYACECCSGFAH